MGAPDRIVRHLRLRGDSEASVRRTARKLEDALRCASLPDDGARMLLVRRLDLGRIVSGASPQTLSLLLEQRVARADASWIHGAAPEAEGSNLVFFRDALEVRCELALRLAKGAPCAAWFWPLAAPEFLPGEGARANLRRIALAIASLPEAPAALPAWVARLAAAGAAPALASAVDEAEGAELLRAAGVPLYTRASTIVPRAPPEPPRSSVGRKDSPAPSLLPGAGYANAVAAHPPWLQALARAGGIALRAPSAVAAGDEPRIELHTAPQAPRASRRGRRRAEPKGPRSLDSPAPICERSALSLAADSAPIEPALESLVGAAISPASRSAFGGLLFLLTVLLRLEYATWAATLPDGKAPAVVRRMLAGVLERLDAPPDDPAWELTASPLDIEEGAEALAELARPWLAACRRWLRRNAGIGVASLVKRRAAFSFTATHADVFFELGDADLRVRRAGLDLDPGWLPWFGRVVGFHYAQGGSS